MHQVEINQDSMGFESACKHNQEGIERVQQLTNFIKKRQAIEEDYAKALSKANDILYLLGKLCKGVSLAPMKKSWFGRASSQSRSMDALESGNINRTSLWSTFYELVDDTAQFSKAHASMAEYLNHQLLEPLQKSLKEQESVKRHVEGEGDHFQRELADAHALFRRAKQAHDDCTLQAVEARAAYERLQLQPSIIRTKEYEKARLKSEAAQERQQIAKHAYRQQEEMFRSCQQRIIEQEMPKLMMRLREAEEHRSREVMSNLLAWIEMERRCAEQTESFTKEMNERIRQINLLADDQLYQQLHQQGPVIPQATAFHAILQPSSPPSPLTAAPNSNSYALMASSPITNPQTFNLPAYQHPNINLPRVPSMPPAYTVTQDLDMLMAAAAIPVAHTASAMCMLQSGDGDQ